MGQRILVMGASGTGKSASLRNFGADEIKLIKIINKPLPFRGKFNDVLVSDKVSEITRAIKSTNKKTIVIDDCQYVMGNEFFRRALEKGYDKFSEIGQNFFNLLAVVDEIPEDVFVYYLSHIEVDANGNEKLKTIGKMLDEKLTVEGYFTVVLKTVCADGEYSFQTQNNGHDTVKSPMGMFAGYLVENDLKMVDSVAREYWGFSDEVVEQHVVAAEKPERKARTRAAETAASETPARTSRKTRAEQLAEKTLTPPQATTSEDEIAKVKAELKAKNEAYQKEMEELEAKQTRARRARQTEATTVATETPAPAEPVETPAPAEEQPIRRTRRIRG